MDSRQICFGEYPVLPDQEVRNLLVKAQSGDELARQRLVECNLRLVRSITTRFAHRGVEMDDLFQIGCIGLVKAIDGFDLGFDVRFSTYAVPKIIGEIKRYLRESTPIKVSRSLRELASRAAALKDTMADELGRPPMIGEIAAKLGVAREELTAALGAVAPVLSLQQAVHDQEGERIVLEDQVAGEPDADSIYLKDVLQTLDPDERRLLLLRYFAEKAKLKLPRFLVSLRRRYHVLRTESCNNCAASLNRRDDPISASRSAFTYYSI